MMHYVNGYHYDWSYGFLFKIYSEQGSTQIFLYISSQNNNL